MDRNATSHAYVEEPYTSVARYEHLPIYRQAFAVALDLKQVAAGFSRYQKYTLGTELR